MIEWIVKKLIAFCELTNRVLTITGTGDDKDVYLVRYFVFRSQYFNFFIHRFLRSDRDDMHDHPWNFMTYLVKGAYTEKYAVDQNVHNVEWNRRCNYKIPNDGYHLKLRRLVFRKAEDLHQVTVDNNLTMDELEDAPLTVCITGRTRRDWGFVKKKRYGQEWILWKKYLGLPEDAPSRG